MSAEEEMPQAVTTPASNKVGETTAASATDPIVEQERSEKILKAKELYSLGSRNFLVKSYADAADELSQVCALYEELHGELSSELGMPYLLYAKSLIALAIDENKVLDVPDEADDEDDDDDDDGEDGEVDASNKETTEKVEKEKTKKDHDKEKEAGDAAATSSTKNGVEKVGEVKSPHEADSTADGSGDKVVDSETPSKPAEETQVSSSTTKSTKKEGNGTAETAVVDGEKPSTSNGETGESGDTDAQEDDEENEAASNLQLAWEILELAAKIFSRQGLSGLSNLAEVQTELANIEFENNIMDAAREDYEKALKIYKDLPKNYHRAMAEIYYKIGLTYLMQQLNKEGAASLKEACDLIEAEIIDIKAKDELTDKDKNNIQDMEETKQEIRAKIDEIEETQAQNIAEVRAALDSYIKPIVSQNAEGAGTSASSSSSASAAASSAGSSMALKTAGASSSTSSITSSSKPTDISHLIKRKKPEDGSSEAEASPAKRPAV